MNFSRKVCVIPTHGEAACLARGERLGNQDMDGSGFEAESSIEAGAETFKAESDQARNMLRIAAGGGEREIKPHHIAVDAKQQQAQDAHTRIIAGEIRARSCSNRVAAISTCSSLAIGSRNMVRAR